VFKPFFKAEGDNKKVAELKILYDKIRKDYPVLPSPGTKDAMIQALHSYETEHLGECVLIPSEDQFYGVSKGENRLSKYIQWVHVPAVKDATDEQTETKNTALGKLLVRTVRAKVNFTDQIKDLEGQAQVGYKKILDDNQNALNEISRSLEKRLSEWSHPDTNLKLEWHQDPEKAVRVDPPMARIIAGEGAFKGNLARFGHGFQRSYLLALLQELSGSDDKDGPKLILSCEEPELYQHPPQARHLFNVFKKLSQGNSQIIICTHSPYFVSGESFEDIRFIRKEKNSSTVSFSTYEAVAEKVLDATGKKPIKPDGTLAKINHELTHIKCYPEQG
jgi:hypothetical protein